MDNEIRNLQNKYQKTGDITDLEALDAARRRANLPVSLKCLNEIQKEFRTYLKSNIQASIAVDLIEYMRKHKEVVDFIRWDGISANEIDSRSFGYVLYGVRVMFKLPVRSFLFDNANPFRTLQNTGEVNYEEDCMEKATNFYEYVKTRKDAELLVNALTDTSKIMHSLRALSEVLEDLTLGKVAVFIFDGELKIMSYEESDEYLAQYHTTSQESL